jgi:hypothetical protein
MQSELHHPPATHPCQDLRQYKADEHEQDREAGRGDCGKPAGLVSRRLRGRRSMCSEATPVISMRRVGIHGQDPARGGGRGVSRMRRRVMAGDNDEVVHPDQTEGQEGDHHEPWRHAADPAHASIVAPSPRHRAPRPLSRL